MDSVHVSLQYKSNSVVLDGNLAATSCGMMSRGVQAMSLVRASLHSSVIFAGSWPVELKNLRQTPRRARAAMATVTTENFMVQLLL
jgi:hypothetical protein